MKIFKPLIIFVCIVIGLIAGYAAGDLLINASEYTRPRDIMEYRVGFPLLGAFVLGAIASLLTDNQ